ncbi:MAG: hypothetical protein ABIH92_04615 [Nanoarchaeota archaeon]
MKDLAALLRWSKKLEIKDQSGNAVETVYVRLVGDLDYQEAQQYALIASRKLRKKLRDKTTINYNSLFLDLEEKSKEDLTFGILMAEMGSFRDLAVEDLGDDVLKLPEYDSSLEEREEHQQKQEEVAQEKIDLLKAKMDEKYEERKKELNNKSTEELQQIYVASTINVKCLEVFSTTFRDYCCFSGTYIDKFTKKAFNSFEEYQNVVPMVKRQILDTYLSLEMSGEQLKN